MHASSISIHHMHMHACYFYYYLVYLIFIKQANIKWVELFIGWVARSSLAAGSHISAPTRPFVLHQVLACKWRSKDVPCSQSRQCGSISGASSPRQHCPERSPPPLGLQNRAVRARSSVRGLNKEMIQSWPTLRAIEGPVV